MDKRNVTRFFVEETEVQIARRPRDAEDGATEVWLTHRQYRLFMALGHARIVEDENPGYGELIDVSGYSHRPAVRAACLVMAKYGLLKVSVRRPRSVGLTRRGKEVWHAWRAKPPHLRWGGKKTLVKVQREKRRTRLREWMRRKRAEAKQ